jgi:hypothetical protein
MRRNAPVQLKKGATEMGWKQYLAGALLHFADESLPRGSGLAHRIGTLSKQKRKNA